MKRNFWRTVIAVLLAMSLSSMPICAAESVATYGLQPRFNNISSAQLTIGFDTNNVVYCTLFVDPYNHGSGVSGLMKLFDSSGTCLEIWSVSDYDSPFIAENTYQGVYGETYTLTFAGYAYSNNQTAPDRLDMSVTDTCIDY